MTLIFILSWTLISLAIVTSWLTFNDFETYFFSKVPGPITLTVIAPAIAIMYTTRFVFTLIMCLHPKRVKAIPAELVTIVDDLIADVSAVWNETTND